MLVTRNMAFDALLNLLKARLVQPDLRFKYFSRRFQTYDRMAAELFPSIMVSSGQENYAQRESIRLPAKREPQTELTIYFQKGQDQTATPDEYACDVLDAIDEALAPVPPQEAQTLGGLVNHCYIEGDILKVPGDLDGIGVIVIPLKILMP